VATPQWWLTGAGAVLLVLLVGIGGSTAIATDSTGTAMQTQSGAVNTTLDVQDLSEPISYSNPGTIRGTLRTANGTSIANEQVRLAVENRTRLVETDGSGAFAFQYRPRSARTGTTNVTVRYVPNQASPYRGDTANLTASVTQVTPTLSLNRTPSRLVFGDELTLTTTVRVDGAGVSDVPVELRIGGTLFKRVVTGSNGTATTTIRLPATVPDGEQSVSAVIPYEDRAIAGQRTTEPIPVEPRPVTVSMDTTRENGAVAVTGAVRTDNGQAVRGRPVRILVDGEQRDSVETDENGDFETRLSATDLPTGVSALTITARYDETGTNLGTAEASATVDLSGGAAASPTAATPVESATQTGRSPQTLRSQIRSFFTLPVIAALVTGVVLVVLEFTVRRLGLFSDAVPESEPTTVTGDVEEPPPERTDIDDSSTVETADGSESPPAEMSGIDAIQTPETGYDTDSSGTERADTGDTPSTERTDTAPEPADSPTDKMGQALAAGEYDSAVTMAYESVADEIRTESGIQNGKTHWELLEWCEDSRLSGDQVEAVRTVVEAYDRAAFSADALDRDSAEAAVECARDFQVDSR
jgi:hypothetical protein